MPVSLRIGAELQNQSGGVSDGGVRVRDRNSLKGGRSEFSMIKGGKSSGNEKRSKVILFSLGDGTDEWRKQMRGRREDLVKGAATSLHLTEW